jgi:hypothetical protein
MQMRRSPQIAMHGARRCTGSLDGRVCVFTATGSLINSWPGTRKARLFAAAGADRRRVGNSPRCRDPAIVLIGRGLLDVELGQSRP